MPDKNTSAVMSPVTARVFRPAPSSRLDPVHEATVAATFALGADTRLSLTAPALNTKSVPPATLSVDWRTWPSVRPATPAAKLALPCRSALARFSVPTALLAVMPVSSTWVALLRLTPVAAVVPDSCSR